MRNVKVQIVLDPHTREGAGSFEPKDAYAITVLHVELLTGWMEGRNFISHNGSSYPPGPVTTSPTYSSLPVSCALASISGSRASSQMGRGPGVASEDFRTFLMPTLSSLLHRHRPGDASPFDLEDFLSKVQSVEPAGVAAPLADDQPLRSCISNCGSGNYCAMRHRRLRGPSVLDWLSRSGQ